MIREAAESIAKRIREVWGGNGPAINVWVDELVPLDETHAKEAFRRLKYEQDRAPSIARFFVEYNQVRREHQPVSTAPVCELCDGTGWVPVEDLVLADGRSYSQVGPCRCSRGRQADVIVDRLFGRQQGAA